MVDLSRKVLVPLRRKVSSPSILIKIITLIRRHLFFVIREGGVTVCCEIFVRALRKVFRNEL